MAAQIEDRNIRRKSIGSPNSGSGLNHAGVKTRRYSIAVTSSQKSNQEEVNILPNYLRASTGSCHDFCKYGKKHEQSNSASPIKPKRTTLVKKVKVTKTVVPVEREKKTMTVTKLKAFLDPIEVIKQNVSLPSKKVEVSKRVLSKLQTDVKPKQMVMKPKVAPAKKVADSPTESQSLKPSVSRVLSLKTKKHKNPKPISPLKDQNRMQKMDQIKEPVSNKVQTETVCVIEAESKAKPDTIELESVTNAPVSDSSESVSVMEVSGIESTIPLCAFKGSPDKEVIEEESLVAPPVSESSQSCYDDVLEDDFEYTDDDDDDVETSVGNHEKFSRKGRMVICEGKDDEAKRLKFRRGKILDLQSDNSNGPRRLKFRKARVMEGDKDGQNVAKRNFTKKDVNQETNDLNSKNAPESVVLKHQGEQGKKDAQGLFNNVIEETASKLVESRKSKVKALVGAFETVISLQDGKPPSSSS